MAKTKTPQLEVYLSGAPAAIRTRDLQLRKLTLYPAELRAHIFD